MYSTFSTYDVHIYHDYASYIYIFEADNMLEDN